ncbi:MBL fold metallo-hydrolase, partial [bacterium]|nr:MBL fold metallo-hydrolase [bacterium]
GHILGSSIFEIWLQDEKETKKLIFSGDLGNPPAPIIADPDFIKKGDILFIESTYGGRLHESKEKGAQIFKDIILDNIKRRATLIMPVFAMERSQEVLYQLNHLVENKIIPKIPVFFDSPLAIRATRIYQKYDNLYDQEAEFLLKSGDNIFDFPNLKFTKTRDESMKINTARSPKIILASSGMCTGGRIPHHLKRNLSNPNNHVFFMSYQAQGTLGRELIEGAKSVIIHDKTIDVNCQITKTGSFSTHADHQQLLNWLNKIKDLKKVFIMHGEELENKKLAEAINKNIETIIPEYDQKYQI